MTDQSQAPSSPAVDQSLEKEKNQNHVANELNEATRQGILAVQEVGKQAEIFSLKTSSVLVGTFGGSVGAGGAYALSLKIATVSFGIAGPIGFAIGLTGSMLVLRGVKSIIDDQRTDDVRRKADKMLDDIRKLPPDAPKELVEKMWKEYERIRLGRITIDVEQN